MSTLINLYKEHKSKVSDKWSIYLPEYDRLFLSYQEKEIRLLEIGIQNGGSLEIWSKYFPNALSLIGCDINPDCSKLKYEDPRVKVIVGDANTDASEHEILSHADQFDLVIDDGSHKSSDIAKTFVRYFKYLNDGGLFVAEDLHCSYWQEFEGGLYFPYSSIAFFKRLADIVNHEHWGIEKKRTQLLEGFSEKYSIEFDENLLASIHSIEFVNSLCVVRKAAADFNVLGKRVIAGCQEFVAPGHPSLAGTFQDCIPQVDNPWSVMGVAPEEAWQELTIGVSERDRQIYSLNNILSERDSQNASLLQAMSERDTTIEALNQAVTERDCLVSSLSQEISAREQALMQVYKSTSWQLTRPIRIIKSFFMKNIDPNGSPNLVQKTALHKKISSIKHVLSLIPAARKHTGSLFITLGKVWSIYRHEGLAGVKHRINYLNARNETSNVPTKYFDRYSITSPTHGNPTISCGSNNAIINELIKTPFRPLFSILVPTYNPRPEWLERTIESVRSQIYPNWELCIADDASTDPEIRKILERNANDDARIKIVIRERNGNISAASNSALEIATGEYVALLDHDDELTVDALYWNWKEISSFPNVEVIYSDEDKISPDGQFKDTFFKPDWSPELMFNCMYMGHLTVYKKSLIHKVGGFRSDYDFSQDYDLALRVTELATEIRHIPRILYHWRQAEGSAAQGGKPYARASNLAALQAALDRRNIKARTIELPTANRVKLMEFKPSVSLIIPTDSEINLTTCINALATSTDYPDWNIIVVTNSKLATSFKTKHQNIKLEFCHYDKPYNFSDKCNVGALQSSAELVVFFNDDVRPMNSIWLEDLIEMLAIPGVGAVSPKLVYEDHRIQHAGLVTGVRGLVGTAFHCIPEAGTEYFCFAQSVRNVSALSGACFAMRREVFFEIGCFDAVNTPIMHSDVDLSFKVRDAGLRCVYTPHAKLLHIGHQSLSEFDKKKKKDSKDKADIYLMKRWGGYLAVDPYFGDNMRALLYRDSLELYGMVGRNDPVLNYSSNDILIITHDLSASGAPMVAYIAAKIIKLSGGFPVIASPVDGPMREIFADLGVNVIVDSLLLTRHDSVFKLARNFDCVLANTVVSWPIVYQLEESSIPVMWYLHESHLIPQLAGESTELTETLRRAKNLFAGSERAASFCRTYNENVRVLNYGVPDIYRNKDLLVLNHKPIIFSVFGSIEPRKGQDIFLEAIGLLPKHIQSKAVFNIVGRTLDGAFASKLRSLANDLEGVHFLDGVDHHHYLELLEKSHIIVCPSRDDTLPLVTLDAMCQGKVVICTKSTGTSDYIINEKNGLIVPDADPKTLADSIKKLIENPELVADIGMQARENYLQYFGVDKFSERLLRYIQLLAKGAS